MEALPLLLHGKLSIEIEGEAVALSFEDDRIVCRVDRFKTLRQLNAGGGSSGSRGEALRKLDAMLRGHHVVLEVIVAGESVARLGHGVEPAAVSRWLGLDGVDLRLSGLARSLLARLRSSSD